jgi:hypothetical protein
MERTSRRTDVLVESGRGEVSMRVSAVGGPWLCHTAASQGMAASGHSLFGPSALARHRVLSDSEVDAAAAAATCMPLCPARGLLTTRAGIQVTTAPFNYSSAAISPFFCLSLSGTFIALRLPRPIAAPLTND